MTVESTTKITTQAGPRDAADLAAAAVLLEIGDRLGVSHLLDGNASVTVAQLADAASIPMVAAAGYAQALLAAGLLTPTDRPQQLMPCEDLADWRYAAGYVTWALDANRPFIDHAP